MGSGGSYACKCPRCGAQSSRDHREPPQLCFDCRENERYLALRRQGDAMAAFVREVGAVYWDYE